MATNNPLKQYFRRPTVYIKLPSMGKYYAPGVVNIPPTNELAIYPMTAIDEITTKTPDALFNGSAMIDLIKSCVPDIKEPWAINSLDLDAILIGIRSASGGSEMEIESKCPKCETVSSFGIDLIGLLSDLTAGDYDQEMTVNELKIKFRPITYTEMNAAGLAQFEVQREYSLMENDTDVESRKQKSQEILKKITELTMKILSEAIEYIQTPTTKVVDKEFILDFLNNCDKNIYADIRDYNTKLKSSSEFKPLKLTCANCANDYEQSFTLNTTDFFG